MKDIRFGTLPTARSGPSMYQHDALGLDTYLQVETTAETVLILLAAFQDPV